MNAFVEETKVKGLKFSVNDLSLRLGISKKTIYEHFDSKSEILDNIIDITIEQMQLQYNQIKNDTTLTSVEKISHFLKVVPKYYQFIDFNVLNQMKQKHPEQWIKMDDFLKEDENNIRELIEQAIKEETIVNKNVSLIMKTVIYTIESILDKDFYLKNRITVYEALNEVVDILLYGLVVREKKNS
ncbi:TetR/AcrR family transcriptional regulator [Bacillus sp. 196mf]|uniref:TetR/AcrR family transcriptional regulator n=1 Tax=Bacillus sp. 196mf TaxID=1761754 RepID=UPI000D9F746B|nr:TetR/AcrR family transcriptional regulator [Bacillus sp. 196mf]PYE88088.1 TetR family transcriptional regulator [Bacillus sp. 196mf]